MSKSVFYRTISAFALFAVAGRPVAPGTWAADRHEIKPGQYVPEDIINIPADPKRVERLIAAGCLDPDPVDSVPVVTAESEVSATTVKASGLPVVAPPVTEKVAGKNSKAREKPAAKVVTEVKAPAAVAPATAPVTTSTTEKPAFVEGDVITLASGGPEMIVESLNEEGMIVASWTNEDETAASGVFAPATVKLVE